MNQFHGDGQGYIGSGQNASPMYARQGHPRGSLNPMNRSKVLQKLGGAVGITVCVGGVNHLTAKRLESRSMKQLLQDKNLSIWSSKDSSMPLASVTLALMLSQGGAFREQMRASTKSKMFPRVQASDRRGSIVRRSFPLYNAIPQKIDIPEEKPTSLLSPRVEEVLESTSHCIKKQISSILHQAHQFSKSVLQKGLQFSLYFPIRKTIDSQSQLLVPASALLSARKSQSPSDTESFFAIDSASKNRSSQDMGPKALPPPLAGGVTMDLMFDANVQVLNSIIFSPKSSFNTKWHKVVNSIEMTEGQWSEEGRRTIEYKSPPTFIVRKPIHGTERQSYRRIEHGELYVVDLVTTLQDVPMGGTFEVHQQFSLTRVDDKRCRIQSSWDLKFVKKTYLQRIIHSKISATVHSNCEKFGKLLQQSFQEWSHSTSTV